MGTEGLEPSRTITRQRILSPSCLPIPPHPLTNNNIIIIILPKSQSFNLTFNRRHPDSNWGMEDLQSTALPLGYTADLDYYNV